MKRALPFLFTLLLLSACARPQAGVAGEEPGTPAWELMSKNTTATVYNAVPSQNNEDCLHTTSMFRML